MKFGLIVNLAKPEAIQLAGELCAWGRKRNNPFLLFAEEASALRQNGIPLDRWLAEVETALVIGGDGTFLQAAHLVQHSGINLFGVSVGHLGFLAVGDPRRVCEQIEQAEAELGNMLGQLTGNEFDMAGIAELKTLLGGE